MTCITADDDGKLLTSSDQGPVAKFSSFRQVKSRPLVNSHP